MELFRRIWSQARTLWAGFSGVVRVALIGGLVLTVALIALGFYLNRAEEVPLFGEPLPAEEVAAVQTVLKAQAIPFTLKDQNTIHVPKEKHAAAKVALAAEGVPVRGGKGLELMIESNNMLSTQLTQTALYQRALQGELTKSIMQVDSVAAARVIIARPESHPFIRPNNPPTASVVLRMKPNAALNRTQASSIVSLVSRSVDGLKPENVTVIDSSGRLLSDPHAGEQESLQAGQMDYRRELEKHLEAKAVALLAARLGPGRAVVQVSADLNPEHKKLRETLYPKDGGVVKHERIGSNKSTGSSARGPAGVESNIRPAAATSGGGSNSAEDRTDTDYLNSETVREIEERMGAVTRLTVAVTADLTPPPAVEGQPAPKALTAAEVESLVQNAVGFKTGRDSIKVTDGVFAGLAVGPPPEPDEETNRIQRWASIVDLVRNVSGGVAIALSVAVLLLFTFARRKKKDATAAAGTPDAATASPAGTTPAAPQTPEDKRRELLERFFQTARTDPDRTASVFGLLVGPAVG